MENAITIYLNSKEEINLYKQLAKRLNNRIEMNAGKKSRKKQVSDDPFFNDPKNIELVEKGIADMKAGKVTRIKDVTNIWESMQFGLSYK